ncbi:hypothetical protein LCGC14_3065200 [marine sediment metagenome]|uniref:Uncharacterized protein n=1 Tax=marine sediment metagenome TaxID=412755 RepID=A0A0F8WHR3_9ZZZZ
MVNNGQVSEDEIENTVDDIPIAAMEAVVTDLPGDYEDEVFAQEVLSLVDSYHKVLAQLRAFRHQGEGVQAEKAHKLSAVLKSQIAGIQYRYPNTVKIYQELASIKAAEMQRVRARLANPL